MRRLFQNLKIRNAKADPSSLQNDRPPTYTSNGTTAPPLVHTLPGRDSVRPPDETSITNTFDVAQTSEATPNYSKRPSLASSSLTSHLYGFC